MALFPLKLPRRSRMKNIQPVLNDMQLRRPKKVAQMRIHGCVQNADLLCRHKARYGVRLPYQKGMIIVIIIGCNEIIFPLPSADAGVRAMPGDGKIIMILVDSSCHLTGTGFCEVCFFHAPVHPFFHAGSVTVSGNSLYCPKLFRRGGEYLLRHFIRDILRRKQPPSQTVRHVAGYGNHVSSKRSLRHIRQPLRGLFADSFCRGQNRALRESALRELFKDGMETFFIFFHPLQMIPFPLIMADCLYNLSTSSQIQKPMLLIS